MGNDSNVIKYLNKLIMGNKEMSEEDIQRILATKNNYSMYGERFKNNLTAYDGAIGNDLLFVIRDDEKNIMGPAENDNNTAEYFRDMKSRLSQRGMTIRFDSDSNSRNIFYANADRIREIFRDNAYLDFFTKIKGLAENTTIAIIGSDMQVGFDKFIIPMILVANNYKVYYLTEQGEDVSISTFTMHSFLERMIEILNAPSLPNYLKLNLERLTNEEGGQYLKNYSYGSSFGQYTRIMSCSAVGIENRTKLRIFKASDIDNLIKKSYSTDEFSSTPYVDFDISYKTRFCSDLGRDTSLLNYKNRILNPVDVLVGKNSEFDKFYENTLKKVQGRYFSEKSSARMSVSGVTFDVSLDDTTYRSLLMEAYLMQVCNAVNEILGNNTYKIFLGDLVGLVINNEQYIGVSEYIQPNHKTLYIRYSIEFEDSVERDCGFRVNRTLDPVVRMNVPGLCDFSKRPFKPFNEEEIEGIVTAIYSYISQFCLINTGLGSIESLKSFIQSDLMDKNPIGTIKQNLLFYWNYYTKRELMPKNYSILPRNLNMFHLNCCGGVNSYNSSIEKSGSVEDRSLIVYI